MKYYAEVDLDTTGDSPKESYFVENELGERIAEVSCWKEARLIAHLLENHEDLLQYEIETGRLKEYDMEAL